MSPCATGVSKITRGSPTRQCDAAVRAKPGSVAGDNSRPRSEAVFRAGVRLLREIYLCKAKRFDASGATSQPMRFTPDVSADIAELRRI